MSNFVESMGRALVEAPEGGSGVTEDDVRAIIKDVYLAYTNLRDIQYSAEAVLMKVKPAVAAAEKAFGALQAMEGKVRQ